MAKVTGTKKSKLAAVLSKSMSGNSGDEVKKYDEIDVNASGEECQRGISISSSHIGFSVGCEPIGLGYQGSLSKFSKPLVTLWGENERVSTQRGETLNSNEQENDFVKEFVY